MEWECLYDKLAELAPSTRAQICAWLDEVFAQRDEEDPACRVCGCTWDTPCPEGCWWVERDLCSSCAEDGAHA